MMQPEGAEKRALVRVIKHCEAIINLEWRVSDDDIRTAKTILRLINKELKK